MPGQETTTSSAPSEGAARSGAGPDIKAVPRETARMWYSEANSPFYDVQLRLQRVVYEGQSEFQHVQVIETTQFGKTLVLDGKTQSALFDEFMYHETLVHPAMLLHPCPKTVYIGGGGELATAREVLRHPCVERVVMVDLDQKVVELCKEHLPEWNDGCTEDPRLEVIYDDAHAYLQRHEGTFDVIIMDIADPIEAGPGIVLYTQEFYQYAASKLNPHGVLVTQSGACSLYNFEECFTAIHNTLKASFDSVLGYRVDIPSFAGCWGFNIAFNDPEKDSRGTFADWAPEKIDDRIAERLAAGSSTARSFRFYDGVTHRGLFGLPKPMRDGMAREDRIITVKNPVFMF
ncbi:Spermidine synthase [Hondaea fermentalgiana]|uniref:thermospermine synthase n=1 Tax=Hondaea fermentalgiana TaxID=2315210 RepID=A0A2R5GUG4_9STRA|nr:Spermidine synthase [Hondaea fermentalgiana]|eukprot:GBG33969.1 Spermidine synthase [Hondaea fermentalgiana]